MNWLDIVLIVFLTLSALRGLRQGIIGIAFELLGYVIAYIVSLKYAFLGVNFISHYFPTQVPSSYLQTIGIGIVWTVVIFAYFLLVPFVIGIIPPIITHSMLNKVGGVIGSFIKGLLIISLILFVLHLLPLPAQAKDVLNQSKIASYIINETTILEKRFGGNISSTLSSTIQQITLIPSEVTNNNQTTEKLIQLGYTVQNTIVDKSDEKVMFTYVNMQRKMNNLPALQQNDKLTSVARNYGMYMFAKGFFSHITPSGQSPVDRIKAANISFVYAGENIAKAPDVNAADIGLINSPEHKANILDSHYQQIGIGVIDGGPYGKMFVQDYIGN